MSNDRNSTVLGTVARQSMLVVMIAYVAVTLAESLLAPSLPLVAQELGLDTGSSARILGSVSLAAGVGNLVGGWLLGVRSARFTSLLAAGVSAVGCFGAAAAQSEATLVAAQVAIGLGAGLFFAGGVFSIGSLAPSGRRGRAMGQYGIAYSLGLAIAAGAVALFGETSWRAIFVGSGVLAVIAMVLLSRFPLPGSAPIRRDHLSSIGPLLGAPLLVGGVAALAQFGLVAYIPLYGTEQWAVSAATAALVLLIGRVVSVPMKSVAGWMIDSFGAKRSARYVGVSMIALGLCWILVPLVWIAATAAVMLAATAGAMFPMANVVAVERFGELGGLLGLFRSAQMLIAGASAWLIGVLAESVGLPTALVVGTLGLGIILILPTDASVRTVSATTDSQK